MEDYESSALRHFSNADSLREAGELDNAGHLIGFAAECAIKFRIATMQPAAGGPHGHFPEIVEIAKKHLGARSQYQQMFNVLKPGVLAGWSVHRRYKATGHTTAAEVTQWFIDTKRLFATANLKRSV